MNSPLRLFLRLAALAGLFGLLPPVVRAFDYIVSNDIAGPNGGPIDSTSATSGTLTVSTTRLAYFKVNVNAAATNPGKIMNAKLRLKVSANGSAGTTHLWAANNNLAATATAWSQGSAWTWGNRPYRDPNKLTTSQANETTAGQWMEFDVTDYISGDGTYSFVLQGGTGASATYYSKDNGTAANRPRLTVTYSNAEADLSYSVVEMLSRGEQHIDRYDLANDLVVATAASPYNRYGVFDVSKQPYGVAGNGPATLDQRLGIQRAINDARAAKAVVYFPAGTYYVGATLELEQGNMRTFEDWQEGGVSEPAVQWNIRDFGNMLAGPAGATNVATLSITSGSTFFNSATSPQPLLHFWSRGNGGSNPATENQAAINYNQTIKHIDLDLVNKAGAIGIEQASAQGGVISDLVITATGAKTGILGGTGPGGGIYRVTIIDGDVGLDIPPGIGAYSPIVAGCTFTGQAEKAIKWTNAGALTVVGCEINGAGIEVNPAGNPWSGPLNLIDTRITIDAAHEADAAIISTRNVYMNRVFAYNCQPLIVRPDGGAQGALDRPNGWIRVDEYAGGVFIDQYPFPKGSAFPASWTPYYLDGVTKTDTRVIAADVTSAPDRRAAHQWSVLPDFTSAAAVENVRDHGATGDGMNDDTDEIRAAIAAAGGTKAVFFPKGDYRISEPIQMWWGTKIFGLNKNNTVIQAVTATPFNSGSPDFLIKSSTNASSPNLLADICLQQRFDSSDVDLLQWQAGTNSEVHDVWFQRRRVADTATEFKASRPGVEISGNGGGRWFNFWLTANNVAEPSNYRHLKVEGTTQNLDFYMLNVEYAHNHPLVQMVDASNINIYQLKAEGNYRTLHFIHCDNFRLFGLAGNASPFPSDVNSQTGVGAPYNTYQTYNQNILMTGNANGDCSNFLVANQAFQIPTKDFDTAYGTSLGAITDPEKFKRLKEVRAGSTKTTPGTEQFVLYKRENPQPTVP